MNLQPLLLTLVLLLGVQVSTAELKNEKECRALADKAMSFAGKGEPEKVFETVKEDWPVAEEELVKLAELTITKLSELEKRFGSVIGEEFVGSEKVGESFLRYTYLQKFEKHAIRWEIVFYRAEDLWLVNNIKWDQSIEGLFRDSLEGKNAAAQAAPH